LRACDHHNALPTSDHFTRPRTHPPLAHIVLVHPQSVVTVSTVGLGDKVITYGHGERIAFPWSFPDNVAGSTTAFSKWQFALDPVFHIYFIMAFASCGAVFGASADFVMGDLATAFYRRAGHMATSGTTFTRDLSRRWSMFGQRIAPAPSGSTTRIRLGYPIARGLSRRSLAGRKRVRSTT
jgi:hypothetical protein